MGLRMIAPKRVKKTKSASSQEVLDRLQRYLNGDFTEPVEILCRFWQDQQDAISYKELRQAVSDGTISYDTIDLWMQDYAVLVTGKFRGVWADAMRAGSEGQPILDGQPFEYNTQAPEAENWIRSRGAQFVTECTEEQQSAIAALLEKKMRDNHTVDELARMIRPCIGLTAADAKAVMRYYDNIVATYRNDHPRMKPDSIRQRARDAAQKYAERKHRQRALTIAQTESAFAYNIGADEGIRQAQEQNLIGEVKKRWSTSGDDRVCDICAALEGVEIDMDGEFGFKGRVLFAGQKRLPPAHPRCACAVEYIEVSPPAYREIPQMSTDIIQDDSIREYSVEEIESMAAQTEKIASKYISVPSKWSGKMVVTEDGTPNSDGTITYYGKLWNCDIITKPQTAPSVILHEQLHARSISHYGQGAYLQYKNIEEASVQFAVEEICKKENISVIASMFDDSVEALRRIGRRIGIYTTDYEFAKYMIEMPVSERLNWLSDHLYDTLGRDLTATLAEYQEMADLLDMLY